MKRWRQGFYFFIFMAVLKSFEHFELGSALFRTKGIAKRGQSGVFSQFVGYVTLQDLNNLGFFGDAVVKPRAK